MKKRILTFLLILAVFPALAVNITGSITSGGITRNFILHAPGASVGNNLPVMIVMHGDGGTGAGMKASSGFDAVADAQNFIAVYPDAVGTSWNRYVDNVPGDAGLGNPGAPDDVLFISDLIDYFCATYGINKNKVYATGHSAGGFMTYNLALQLPTKIAAFAPVAGSMWGDNAYMNQKFGAGFVKVPIYHVHGDADPTVPFPDNDHTPVAWQEWPLNNFSSSTCNSNTYSSGNVSTVVAGVQKIQFCANSAGSKEISLIRIMGVGHAWPNVAGFNCAQSIYNFCNAYSLSLSGTCGSALSSAKEIVSFAIPGQVGASQINSAAATVHLTMPSGTNVSALAGSFTLSANATCNLVNSSTQNFTNPVNYVVTAQDNSTKTWTVSVSIQPIIDLNGLPNPCLIGYLHNWDDSGNGYPYLPLDQVNTKYNVINYAFANTNGNGSNANISLVLDPAVDANPATRTATFISKMQMVQAESRKVLLSIGGAVNSGGLIQLKTISDRTDFVNSVTNILSTYPFDGIDINMEDTCFIFGNFAGTVSAPASPTIDNFIFAIKQIMTNYRNLRGKKMLLTFAPERPAISGGRSNWQMTNMKQVAGYLPIIEALKDSLDAVHTQLYGVADDFGYNGVAYNAGTVDGALANLENQMNGYTLILGKGTYTGMPANKTVMGVASNCIDASQNALDTNEIKQVVGYLRNDIPQPGAYPKQSSAAKQIRGLMVWSINLDAKNGCGNQAIATLYSNLFTSAALETEEIENLNSVICYPNPTTGEFKIKGNKSIVSISAYNLMGEKIELTKTGNETYSIDSKGVYFLQMELEDGTTAVQRVVIK